MNLTIFCVNLPRWGLKPIQSIIRIFANPCKFTPLGFETIEFNLAHKDLKSVNLPRWGLKLWREIVSGVVANCVNLPRWGLKREIEGVAVKCRPCKFTPLGFETTRFAYSLRPFLRVNLPRWGLKLPKLQIVAGAGSECKFTPLGFETGHLRQRSTGLH